MMATQGNSIKRSGRRQGLGEERIHTFADIFPLLGSDELKALADDIAANGQREPIWLFEGKVLDGRNRLAACELAKVEPKVREFKGTSEAALRFVWSMNLKRRHLTPSQAAACVVEFEALLAEFAAEGQAVQKTGKGVGGSGGRGKKTLASGEAKVSKHAGKTASKVAQQVGVSRAQVERALALKKADPEKLAEVKAGKKSLSQATREVKKAQMQAASALPTAKYRVVYVDPPWNYNDKADDGAVQAGGSEKHYPSMTIAELCALDVPSLCEPDSVMFMWATSPLLFECLPVIKAWNFDYRASIVWHKLAHNMGHYVSVRHEFLLICTRGSCTPDTTKRLPSVVEIKRGAHSVKPEEFRQMIDEMYPQGKRIELFARKSVVGWDAWGNEA